MILADILDALTNHMRFIVREQQRTIVLYKGRFETVLTPGEHRLRADKRRQELVSYDIARPEFDGPLAQALLKSRPEGLEPHVVEFRAGLDEVLVVLRDGRVHAVLKPEDSKAYWVDAGPWAAEAVPLSDDLVVPPALGRRLLNKTDAINRCDVQDGHVALLYADGAFVRLLEPGQHLLWAVRAKPTVRHVDLRRQAMDVSGQEILTRDRVTLRVNIAADYHVADPVKAANQVKDYADALYRALQFAFRKSLGAKSLDQILADKVTAEAEAVETVRREMAEIGLSVGDIAVKDVILPGDMRDILNKVVAAEKEAEANVIRRREETNATRSLLNTARIMAENPVMLRLKELEALSDIAAKVDRLTIHNGTAGLLNDLVQLRDQT